MLLVRYSEISLKGKNKFLFVNKLIKNIWQKLPGVKIQVDSASILVDSDDLDALKTVFGINTIAQVEVIKNDFEEIKAKVLSILQEKKPKTFRITANRSDKTFPIKSQDLAREIGKICEEKGYEVRMKKPDLTIFVDVLKKRTLVYLEKFAGLGGLPVGTSGKVLCLFSGGIDSPVAAYLMAKRGCTLDFLHFYAGNNIEIVKKSKIPKLVAKLADFCGKSVLYAAPIGDFEVATLDTRNYELQLFRRYILLVADKFARENNYSAIVLGDNLNQVASQTLENISVTQYGIATPIFRPLLAYDKQEIIDLARKIKTYDLSVEKYKDCCAIIAKRPKTKMRQDLLVEEEMKLAFDSLIEKTIQKIQKI